MPNWRDELPEEIRGSEALANFENVGQMAQSFLEAKKYQGQSLKIPGEDAGEEDRQAFIDKLINKVPTLMPKPNLDDQEQSVEFYRSLGMPETKDAYEPPEIEIPEGVKIQEEKAEIFKEIAHKHGLTTKQYKGMMADILSGDIEESKATLEAIAENQRAIKEKFGHAFKDNMNKIVGILTKTDAPEFLIEEIKGGSLDIDTVEWLYQLSKSMGGEGTNFDEDEDQGGRDVKMTPDEAKAAIAEINANRQHPYWVGTGEEKQRATQRMVELMRFANP